MKIAPNHLHAANLAMAPLFHKEHPWSGVNDAGHPA
jgi:hypothetical protein